MENREEGHEAQFARRTDVQEVSNEEGEQPVCSASPNRCPEDSKKKQKRNVSAEARRVMLENLAKARAVAAANRSNTRQGFINVKKYPKHKRSRAEEMYIEDVKAKAEEKLRLLAEETLRKKEEEKEFQDFKRWKESQSHYSAPPPPKEDKVPQRTTRKKTPVPKPKKPKSSASNKISSTRSAQCAPEDSRSDDGVSEERPILAQYPYRLTRTTFNIDDYLG